MTTHTPGDPQRTVRLTAGESEFLEARPFRWGITPIVVLALLAGLAIGRVAFGGEVRELDSTREALEAATTQMTVLSQKADELQARLSGVWKREEDLDAAVVALAGAFQAGQGPQAGAFQAGPGPGAGRTPPHYKPADVAADFIRSYNLANMQWHMAAFTDDAVLTVFQGSMRSEYRGVEDIRDRLEAMDPLRATSGIVAHGQFAWVGFSQGRSTGVMVLRVVGGHVSHQWLVIDRAR